MSDPERIRIVVNPRGRIESIVQNEIKLIHENRREQEAGRERFHAKLGNRSSSKGDMEDSRRHPPTPTTRQLGHIGVESATRTDVPTIWPPPPHPHHHSHLAGKRGCTRGPLNEAFPIGVSKSRPRVCMSRASVEWWGRGGARTCDATGPPSPSPSSAWQSLMSQTPLLLPRTPHLRLPLLPWLAHSRSDLAALWRLAVGARGGRAGRVLKKSIEYGQTAEL